MIAAAPLLTCSAAAGCSNLHHDHADTGPDQDGDRNHPAGTDSQDGADRHPDRRGDQVNHGDRDRDQGQGHGAAYHRDRHNCRHIHFSQDPYPAASPARHRDGGQGDNGHRTLYPHQGDDGHGALHLHAESTATSSPDVHYVHQLLAGDALDGAQADHKALMVITL